MYEDHLSLSLSSRYKRRSLLPTLLTIGISVFLVSGIVVAATTIGSSLSTDGNLTVLGNAGIGTSTPSARFSVTGDGTGATRAFVFANASNVEKITILNNGNIGIGTTSPNQVLSLAGNIYITGGINPGGGNVGIGTTTPTQLLTVAGNAHLTGAITLAGPAGLPSESGDYTHETGDSNLKGAWDFSEGTGTKTYDRSGNGNAGTLTGFTMATSSGWTSQGRFGPALYFNGTSNDVSVSTLSQVNGSSAFSAEAWIKADTSPPTDWPIIFFAPGLGYLQIATPGFGGGIYFSLTTSNSGTVSPWPPGGSDFGSLYDNKWHHVAFIYDGSTVSAWVDGVRRTGFVSASGTVQTTGAAHIGSVGATNQFKGVIDSVAVYNRALTLSELIAHTSIFPGQSQLSDITYTGRVNIQQRSDATASSVIVNSSQLRFLGAYWNGSASANVTGGILLGVASTSPTYALALQTAGSTRMSIDQSGLTGIATTTPYAQLSVASGAVGTPTLALRPIASQTANVIDIYSTAGALHSVYTASGFFGVGSTSPAKLLSVQGNALVSGTLTIESTLTATTSALLATNGGTVGIGATSSPASLLAVKQSADTKAGGLMLAASDGDTRGVYMNTSGVLSFEGGDGGTINTASLNAAGAWTNASDVRYKEDIQDLSYGLDTILKLKPRSYTMKGTRLKQIGFIAQEMKPLIPEVVDGEEGSLGISYGNLTAAAIKAIQELNNKIDKSWTINDQGQLVVKEIKTEKLEVGSSAKPEGITLYDDLTGEPYCTKIRNGDWAKIQGTCAAVSAGR